MDKKTMLNVKCIYMGCLEGNAVKFYRRMLYIKVSTQYIVVINK